MDDKQSDTITKEMKFMCNCIAGIIVLLSGVFLLLCGINILPFNFSAVLAASIFCMFFVMFIIVGVIQKNVITTWIAFAFFVPFLVEILVLTTSSLYYNNIYPLYIAIPAVCSVANAIIYKDLRSHYTSIIFFGGLGGLFALQSFGILGWAVVIPLVILFVVLCVVAVCYMTYKEVE